MIETRRLTERELNMILSTAPDTEKRNLISFVDKLGLTPYIFFDTFAIEHSGIIIDGKPIYVAVLMEGDDEEFELWTVADRDIKHQYSLFKYSKRVLMKWVKKYKKIYATMEKINDKNMRWTSRLGFKKILEDEHTITFCIEEGR